MKHRNTATTKRMRFALRLAWCCCAIALLLGPGCDCGSLPTCISDDDCSPFLRCTRGICQAECIQDQDCPPNHQCPYLQCIAPKPPPRRSPPQASPPLSCKLKKVTPQSDGSNTLTLTCNGQDKTFPLPKTQRSCKQCDSGVDCNAGCKAPTRCNDGACWPPGTQHNPATSCNELLNSGHAQGTGIYWLKAPKGKTDKLPFRVYCDMDTDGGGWTLCLNTRYSHHARHLFTKTYQKIYPPQNDPFGYYDFCPGGENDTLPREFRFSLVHLSGSSFVRELDLYLLGPQLYTLERSDYAFRGVRVQQAAQSIWLKAPTLPNPFPAFDPPKAVLFWSVYQDTDGVRHAYRGATSQRPYLGTQRDGYGLWMGTGCRHQTDCNPNIPQSLPPENSIFGYHLFYASLILVNDGPDNPNKKSKVVAKISADRTQVLYR